MVKRGRVSFVDYQLLSQKIPVPSFKMKSIDHSYHEHHPSMMLKTFVLPEYRGWARVPGEEEYIHVPLASEKDSHINRPECDMRNWSIIASSFQQMMRRPLSPAYHPLQAGRSTAYAGSAGPRIICLPRCRWIPSSVGLTSLARISWSASRWIP